MVWWDERLTTNGHTEPANRPDADGDEDVSAFTKTTARLLHASVDLDDDYLR